MQHIVSGTAHNLFQVADDGNHKGNMFLTGYAVVDGDVYSHGVNLFANRLLWSGAYYMTSTHKANLDQKVSEQPNGIVLIWSQYDRTNSQVSNMRFQFTFIPKYYVSAFSGYGVSVILGASKFANICTKYVYVTDNQITGNDENDDYGTSNGITYDNRNYVLRAVVGV